MWFNGQSPYMGMLSGMMGRGATPMTPGAGMPPQGNAPMNMQIPQMPTPQVAQSNVPIQPQGQGQQGQQPINPAQMGMLAQMLQQQTAQPASPGQPVGAPGQGVSRQAGYGDAMSNPGILSQIWRGLFGG